MKKCALLFILLFLPFKVFAEEVDTLPIAGTLERDSYTQGDTVTIAVSLEIPKEYHLYANPMGPGIGRPTTVTPNKSQEITWLFAKQQKPEKYIPMGMEDLWAWSWHDSAVIFVTGVLDENAPESVEASFSIEGLICKTACLPIIAEVTIAIPVQGRSDAASFETTPALAALLKTAVEMPLEGITTVAGSEPEEKSIAAQESGEIPVWSYVAQESQKKLNLGLALVFAFIAGLILNFMPCVLPVLGIKILSFSKGRTGSKATAVGHSLAFAAGMILIFLVLATLAAFAGMSWGEQFQNPVFIVVLVSMMFVFALGMFDLFIIFVPNKVAEMDMKQDSSGVWGNFAKGMFATILATPCSGPFLGATLAWTLTQPKLVVYLVFLSLGMGMASPYVLLAASSRLSKIIPKPGAWMEDFKHFLGFFLFGFGIYLMIGLPRDMVLPTVSLLLALAAAVMLYGRVAPFGSAKKQKIVAVILSLLLVYGGYYVSFEKLYPQLSAENAKAIEHDSQVTWEEFSVEAIETAHAEGRDIMIDFTANWCMNCQFNKINVYHTKEVEKMLLEKDVLAIKADLTDDDPVAESLRNHLGSRSIPFLAIFNSDNPDQPVVMRDLVSKKKVLHELSRLRN